MSDEPRDAQRARGLDLARSVARSLAGGKGSRSGGGTQPGARGRRRSEAAAARSSSAHPDDRDPQTLDATVQRLIGEQGWSEDIRVHGVFSRWDRIVGRQVAEHARPVSLLNDDSGGRLVVRTDSTAWATQMKLLAPTVLRRLNEELGDGTVRIIDVQGPSAPSWKHGRLSTRDGRGPRDTYG